MKMMNMYMAKTQLSKLVDLALSGEEVVIAKSGKPLVTLIPYEPSTKNRVPRKFANKITVPEDFDAPIAEIEDLFYGDTQS